MILDAGDEVIEVDVAYRDAQVVVTVAGEEAICEGRLLEAGALSAVVDGQRMNVQIHQFGGEIHIYKDRHLHVLCLRDPLDASHLDEAAGGNLTAPMSGKILSVNTEAGARVKKGDALIVLEAMKMEHTLVASSDLVVDQVMVGEGDQVDEGQVVVIFDTSEDS